MISRVCWVSIALLAMLAVAIPCLADEAGYVPGKGGIGGQLGGSTFRLDRNLGSDWFGDYSLASKPRFGFAAEFRYVIKPWLRWQVSPGLAFTDYFAENPAPFKDNRFPTDTDKGSYLTIMVPISAQAQVTMRRGIWLYYAGAGPGLYRVWVQNHREVLKDPITFKRHRALYFGGSGQLGVERFFKSMPSTSLEISLTGNLARARNDEDFPSGLNSNVMSTELRAGLNFYFVPGWKKAEQPPAPGR